MQQHRQLELQQQLPQTGGLARIQQQNQEK